MKTYIKNTDNYECLIYKYLLPALSSEHDHTFSILKLPQALEVDCKKKIITLPYYSGKKYNCLWQHGGTNMKMQLSKEIALVILDLEKINIKNIRKNKYFKKIPGAIFDFKEWYKIFLKKSKVLMARGYLSKQDVAKAKLILKGGLDSKMIFSNGDFYPRNFIKSGKKIILIDWQVWAEDYRVNLIDYFENIVAFCYVHMWSSPAWQKSYILNIKKHFVLDEIKFQKALLIKSFDQAVLWLDSKRAIEQIKIFKDSL